LDIINSLRNQGQHLTRQRMLVLEILNTFPGHPDAGMIFLEAKKRDDRISLATVYRSLAWLKEAGLIEENHLGEGHGHFEATQQHHYHFACETCGKVIEFDAAAMPEMVQSISGQLGIQVTEVFFDLHGYCPECRASHALTASGERAGMAPAARHDGRYGTPQATLSDLSAGDQGIVSHLAGNKEFINRVACLGFTIGAQVTVLQNHNQGPMIVSLLGAHIALGRQEAALIQVKPL
jgi:Fe2+ or Zn2+ uptake regulation protein/Fe2+ transport system protein FeoA